MKTGNDGDHFERVHRGGKVEIDPIKDHHEAWERLAAQWCRWSVMKGKSNNFQRE